MTPDQCREARRLLGWSRNRLGSASGAGVGAIEVYERLGRVARAGVADRDVDRLTAIRVALEQAGVVFTKGAEAGVKLRKPK